jgi:hypothetical protein
MKKRVATLAFLTAALLCTAQEAPPGPKVFRGAAEILALIPKNISLKQKGQWNPVAVTVANDSMKQALGQPATLHVRVAELGAYKGGYGAGFRIKATAIGATYSGTAIPVQLWLYFPQDAAASLLKIGKGSEVTVNGVIRRADFSIKEDAFFLDANECKIGPP